MYMAYETNIFLLTYAFIFKMTFESNGGTLIRGSTRLRWSYELRHKEVRRQVMFELLVGAKFGSTVRESWSPAFDERYTS